MARDFLINGESMVTVKGGAHTSGIRNVTQLALASEGIIVSPRIYSHSVKVDDFGPYVPPEVMIQIAEVNISMTLVHTDYDVLRECIAESIGGMTTWGMLSPAGTMMGRGKALYTSGCHWMGLSIASPFMGIPWTFPSAYLPSPPINIPLGTTRMLIQLDWRAIPYVVMQSGGAPYTSGDSRGIEIQSSGAVLWTHMALE